jgi:pyridoxine 5'-phosphate synthase PdxJ
MFRRLIAGVLLVLGVGLFLPGCKGQSEMRGKFRKEAMVEKMDKIAKTLNLTKEQTAKFEELKSKITAKMDNGLKERTAFREEMLIEVKKDNPDVKLLADSAKERIDTASKNAKDSIDLFTDFYNILDENQKKAFIEKVHKKISALETLREE